MKVTINVTQEDINRGRPHSTYSCPVAIALKRALKESEPDDPNQPDPHVYVSDDLLVRINGCGIRAWEHATPAPVRTFIVEFDSTRRGSPFSFDLDIQE